MPRKKKSESNTRKNGALVNGEYLYSQKQQKFLEVFAETGDTKQAAQLSGYPNHRAQKNEWMVKEMEHLQKLKRYAARMVAGVASQNHARLMQKFEEDYDKAEDWKERTQYANVLSRMSDSSMRATGEYFQPPEQGAGTNVNVIIDLGGKDNKQIEPETINVEVEHDRRRAETEETIHQGSDTGDSEDS